MSAKVVHTIFVLLSCFWIIIVLGQLSLGVYLKDNEMVASATKVLMALLLPSVVPTAAGIVARNTPPIQGIDTHAQS